MGALSRLYFLSCICMVANKILLISSRKISLDTDRCMSSECEDAGTHVASNLNMSVKPCEDFFQFACGGWMNRHTIPENKDIISVFSEFQKDLPQKLSVLLERNLTGTKDVFIYKMKVLYDTCMDEQSIEKEGSRPLKNILKALGGWPLLEGTDWNGKAFDWVKTLIRFRELGYSHNILFEVSITDDPWDSSATIVKLDQPLFGTDRKELLVNEIFTKPYAELMKEAVYYFRFEDRSIVEIDRVRNEMENMLKFENILAYLSLVYDKERKKAYSRYERHTVQTLIEDLPQVDWIYLLEFLLKKEVNASEPFIIPNLNFLKTAVNFIIQSDQRDVANYMMWRVVHQSLPLLSRNWTNLESKFIEIPQFQSRLMYCVNFLNDSFGIDVNSYYVRLYFNEKSRKEALILAKHIRNSFTHILSNANWMGKDTKKAALEKVRAIKFRIEHSRELLHDSNAFGTYENLHLNDKSYFDNALSVRKLLTDKYFSQLWMPRKVKELEEYEKPFSLENFYNYTDNSIALRPGIFRDPFFNIYLPNYLNFGALGSLIAYELFHAFDDTGRHLNKDGNVAEWWTDYAEKHFKAKAQCLVKQYRINTNIYIDTSETNGRKAEEEIISGIGGLKAAYWAYQAWVVKHRMEPKLSTLKFSPNQLFWIRAANIWCEKADPKHILRSVLAGSHIPQKFRMIGSLSNVPEFAQDFCCSRDISIDQQNRCQVW